jgi:Protein of unknown function (DUF3995)
MYIFIASILGLIFLLLSTIHIYWALGGKWGLQAAIPTNENNELAMNPQFVACIIVATILFACVLYILTVVKILSIPFPSWIVKYGTYFLAIVFLLRAIGDFKYVGFFKKIKVTLFAKYDTKYFSPLCILISVLAFIVAASANAL